MSNYLKLVPIETYQKVLLHLNPENLKLLCQTDKYVQNACKDNYFNYQYIKLHYDSYEYGYASWEYNKDINWKSLLDKLSSMKKQFMLIDGNKYPKFNIHKNDTILDIIDRISRVYELFNINKVIKFSEIFIGGGIMMYYESENSVVLVTKISEQIYPQENISLYTNIGTYVTLNGKSIFDSISDTAMVGSVYEKS